MKEVADKKPTANAREQYFKRVVSFSGNKLINYHPLTIFSLARPIKIYSCGLIERLSWKYNLSHCRIIRIDFSLRRSKRDAVWGVD